MLKLLSVIFAALYLFLSVGVSLNLHHCKEEVYVAFYEDAKGACACFAAAEEESVSACHTQEDKGDACCHVPAVEKPERSCCYDQELNLQYESKEQIPSVNNFEMEAKLLAVFHVQGELELEEPLTQFMDHPDLERGPPDSTELWLKYQNLTYYG